MSEDVVRVLRLCVACGKLPLSVNERGRCEPCEAECARRHATPECMRVGSAFVALLGELGPRFCRAVSFDVDVGARCSHALTPRGLRLGLDPSSPVDVVIGEWFCPRCRASYRERVA